MIHLSIQGPQAVGKTTALRGIECNLPHCAISYECPYPTVEIRTKLGLDIRTKIGFITNQRLFIDAEIKRYKSIHSDCVIFDRGPEDTECYTVNFPKVIGECWDIETAMRHELFSLRRCHVDRILYLDASPQSLLERKERDQHRHRGSFDLHAFSVYRNWYLMRADCDYLNVDGLSKTELGEEVEHWIIMHKTANKGPQWTPLRGATDI